MPPRRGEPRRRSCCHDATGDALDRPHPPPAPRGVRAADAARALADQLERAATSVALSLAEAGGARGRGDRVRVLRIAAGEAREVRAALAVASAWGYLDAAEVAPADAVADRLGGVLYGRMRRGG
ncbi:MAG: four helix bundle protein [Kofleriaceae bacterium]|nr:four helix bundle protein [Kofleriaceae bacterium]